MKIPNFPAGKKIIYYLYTETKSEKAKEEIRKSYKRKQSKDAHILCKLDLKINWSITSQEWKAINFKYVSATVRGWEMNCEQVENS